MDVTAIIMAGGKGSRMGLSEEKSLLKVGGKPMIAWVIESLLDAKKVDAVVVAVTDNSPKTAHYVSSFPVRVVKTPGKDYIFDMQHVVKKFGLRHVLTVAADLPFITGKIIDEITECYERCGKPALAVVVPMETKKKLGMSEEYAFFHKDKLVVPTGINLVDGQRIDEYELDQDFYISDQNELAININTIEELRTAEKLLQK